MVSSIVKTILAATSVVGFAGCGDRSFIGGESSVDKSGNHFGNSSMGGKGNASVSDIVKLSDVQAKQHKEEMDAIRALSEKVDRLLQERNSSATRGR